MAKVCNNAMTPTEVALEWASASACGDVDRAAAMIAEGARRFGGLAWSPVDRAFYVERWKIFVAAFSPYHLKVVNHFTNGNAVALEMVESATFSRPYLLPDGRAIPPNFQSYVDHVCTVVEVDEDGLIAEIRAYIPSNLEVLIATAARAMV